MTKPADLKKPAARGRSGPLKSAERAAIEATLKDAAAPLTRDEVAQRTGIAARKVLITLGNLVHLAKVAHRLPPSAGHPLTRWAWGARPEAGEKADEVPAGQYQGRELRAFSARPGAEGARVARLQRPAGRHGCLCPAQHAQRPARAASRAGADGCCQPRAETHVITEQDNAAERRRKLWIWLRQAGGTWSASEVGLAMNLPKQQAAAGLSGLARAGYVSRSGALPACLETRYAVTGGCLVPMGVTVNEVEAAC